MSFPFLHPDAIAGAWSAASEGIVHAAMHSKNVAEGLVAHAAQLDPKFVADAAAATEGFFHAASEGIVHAAMHSKDAVEGLAANAAQLDPKIFTDAAAAAEGFAHTASEGLFYAAMHSKEAAEGLVANAAQLDPKIFTDAAAATEGLFHAASEGLFHAAMHSKNAVEGLVAHAAQLDPKVVTDAAVAGAGFAATRGLAYAARNPRNIVGAAAAAGGLLVVAVPVILTGPLLAVVGFGSSGPVAGEFKSTEGWSRRGWLTLWSQEQWPPALRPGLETWLPGACLRRSRAPRWGVMAPRRWRLLPKLLELRLQRLWGA